MEINAALAQINKSQAALEQASDIHEILNLRDKAQAVQMFAAAQGAEELAQEAKIFQLKAERKAGGWLSVNVSAGNPQLSQDAIIRKLPDGVDKDESRRWQLEAKVPEEAFNDWVDECLSTGKEISATGLYRMGNDIKREQRRIENSERFIGELPIEVIITTGDFRDVLANMPADSVDMIFTDPPYDEESIPLYKDLAQLGARVLRPGGSLITYVGHYAIPKITRLMDDYLRYWWILNVSHSGASARLIGKNVFVEWKPMLWYVKDYRRHDVEWVADMVVSDVPTKEEHDWQQGYKEANYYIDKLTLPGELVIDPFAGSGTTLISAYRLKRKAIGIEIDEQRANMARTHIQTECGLQAA